MHVLFSLSVMEKLLVLSLFQAPRAGERGILVPLARSRLLVLYLATSFKFPGLVLQFLYNCVTISFRWYIKHNER